MRAERRLALCRAEEHHVLKQLYHFQAGVAEKRVHTAEEAIGGLRDTMRHRGFRVVAPFPSATKIRPSSR